MIQNPIHAVPCRAQWLIGARPDPATGLVAFRDLYPNAFATALRTVARDRSTLGVAIGDVDDLRVHIEHVNATDPDSFGHLAGSVVMARLGRVTRGWFAERIPGGCVATFGGDEVIVVATGLNGDEFTAAVTDLRDRCGEALPCTVSFATTVVNPDMKWPTADPAERAKLLLAGVDRALFAAKAARHATDGPGGTVVTVDLDQAVRHVAA